MTSVDVLVRTWGVNAGSDVAATSDVSTFSSLTWKQNIFLYQSVGSSWGIRLMKHKGQEASLSWTAPHRDLTAV